MILHENDDKIKPRFDQLLRWNFSDFWGLKFCMREYFYGTDSISKHTQVTLQVQDLYFWN